MDLFTQVKMAVSVKEAAEYYGLEVKRGSMVCCPFHNDRTPSMKLNEDYPSKDHQHSGSDEASSSCRGLYTGSR